MRGKTSIYYRRRQADWQSRVFMHGQLEELRFADLDGKNFNASKLVPVALKAAQRKAFGGGFYLDEQKGIELFRLALGEKRGVELERDASKLLLTETYAEGPSDWARFCEWVARRAQPLDPLLLDGIARFYIGRLNRLLDSLRRVRPVGRRKTL